MTDKDIVRRLIREHKKNVSATEKHVASDRTFKKLYSLTEWQQAEKVLFYYSLPDELQTIEQLQSITDKKLFLPRVNGSTLDILPYSTDCVDKGAYNIIEPRGNQIYPIEEIDLIIVPGMAFDKQCNRLGRGKGYYDSILSKCEGIKIGVGYDFQLLEHIPTEQHDIKMDIVITPSFIIRK